MTKTTRCPQCNQLLSLDEKAQQMPLENLACPKCESTLAPPEEPIKNGLSPIHKSSDGLSEIVPCYGTTFTLQFHPEQEEVCLRLGVEL